MAHLVELKDECQIRRCYLRAVVEVRNRWNASMGFYCRAHGKRELIAQQSIEERSQATLDRHGF